MDWLEHLISYDLWAFAYAQWQAGFNMIPGKGFADYMEAWAETKKEELS
jgi:hypothetical protein